jgi:hypothetical protein
MVVTAIVAGDAAADSDAELTKHADELASAGQFEDAAAAYLDAYAIVPNPALICNAGVAYFKAKQLPRAHVYLSECALHGVTLDAHFISVVRANLGEIEASLRAGDFTPVDVRVEPKGSLVAAEDFALHGAIAPRVIWMAFGDHVLTVTADGYVERRIPITARGKDTLPVQVKLEPVPAVSRVVYRAEPAPKIRLVWPVVSTAATVAFGGLIILAHAEAASAAKRAGFALNNGTFADDSNTVNAWNQVLGFAVGGAIAGAAASVFLWRRHLVRVDVEAKPGVAMVELGGVF